MLALIALLTVFKQKFSSKGIHVYFCQLTAATFLKICVTWNAVVFLYERDPTKII